MTDEHHPDDGRTDISRRNWLKTLGVASGASITGLNADVAAAAAGATQVGAGSYTTTYPGSSGNEPPTTDELLVTDNVDQPIPTNGVWSGMHFEYNPYSETTHPYSNGATVTYPYFAKARDSGLRVQLPDTWQGWRDPWDTNEDVPAPIDESDFVRMDYAETPRLVIGNTDTASYANAKTHDYGDWHNTARWGDGTATAMDVTQVRGCPFLFAEYSGGGAEISLLDESDAALDDANVTVFADQGNVLGVTVEPTTSGHSVQHFGLYAPDGATWSGKGTSTLTSDLAGAGYLTVATLPDGTTATLDEFEQYAYNVVTDTAVDWTYDQAASAARTTYTYTLDEKAESASTGTLSALFPSQWKYTDETFTGHEFWSPKGTMKVVSGSSFRTEHTYNGILPVLPDVGTYDGAQLDDYLSTLKSQYGPYESQGVPACAYWSGKDYMRNAQAAPLADVRGLTAERDYFLQAMRGRLSTYLDVENNTWSVDGESFSTASDEEVFYYHDDLGVIQSYPDCEFGGAFAVNDHHFHYGYFVNAAAEVARLDPQWAEDNNLGGMVKLLIRDYANWERPDPSNPLDPSTYPKDSFPFLRNFEPYAGMSHAAGINGNVYGQNQESSSEAIAAYAAMVKWGEVTGDTDIRDAGIWLYTREVAAAREYWFDEDGDSLPDDWGSNLAPDELDTDGSGPFEYNSQTWDVGSWRTVYWDTSDPIETYGINFLPMGGHSYYLGYDKTYHEANWGNLIDARDALVNGPSAYDRWLDGWQQAAWGYRAMTNPARAISPNMSDELPIPPGGSSSAFVYHFVHQLNEIGLPDESVTADTPFYQVFYDAAAGERTYVAYNAGSSTSTVTFSDGTTLDVPAGDVAYTSGSSGSGSAPVVDSLSASEVETSDADAEFDVSWSVSDADGDLASLDLTLTDDTAGATEETVSVTVSGGDVSGTTRLVAPDDDGTGNAYTVDAVVTDAASRTGSDATTVTESESDTGGSGPSIDAFALTDDSAGPWAKATADWTVADADGDLASVDLELVNANGTVVDSVSTAVSGGSASGTDTLREKSSGTYDVVLTVTDAAGATTTQTKTITLG